MASQSNTQNTIPTISIKLTKENYETWSPLAKQTLVAYDLGNFIEEGAAPPTKFLTESTTQSSTVNPAYTTWVKKDSLACVWLKGNITEKVLPLVAKLETSRQVWSKLETTFKSQNQARAMRHRTTLTTLEQGTMSVFYYIQKKTESAEELTAVGTKVFEDELVQCIMRGLDTKYNTFKSAFNLRSLDSPISADELLGLLLDEEERLKTEEPKIVHDAYAANYHRGVGNNQNPNYQNKSFSRNRNSFNDQGYRKNQQHHGQNKFGGSGNYINNNKGKSSLFCQICDKRGHVARECYHRFDHSYSTENPQKVAALLASPTSPQEESNWFVDSGASAHLTADLNNLSVHSEYQGDDKIKIGNGKLLTINNIGTSSLSTPHHTFILKNVLHVPCITKNLLSVSQFTRDNHVSLEFFPDTCLVKNMQGQVLLRGTLDQGLYQFPTTTSVLSPFKNVFSTAFIGERTSLSGWHNRLGHPNDKIVRKTIYRFHLPSINLNKETSVCGPCQLGKSHRLHLPSFHAKSNVPFELVYSDVWGPAPITSINGFRYFVQFLDDCTKYIWFFLLRTRDEVFDIFQHFFAMVKTQFGHTIKTLQTDWGGEYRKITSFLSSLGVHHRHSCPHTQEQNGAPERRHRDIVAKGLALQAHASLPTEYWEYAFSTTVYLMNRTITPLLSFKSPYECLYNRAPNYKFLRTFGCLCYPFIRPYNTYKLEYRSKPCVFLGYSTKHKGYLCLHLETKRLYIARHVIFDESKYPFHSLTTSSPTSHSSEPPSEVTLQLLHDAASVPNLSENSDATPTLTISNETPSSSSTPTILNQSSNSSISSDTSSTQPPPYVLRHLRPADNSTHSMETRARTNNLKPKALMATTK